MYKIPFKCIFCYYNEVNKICCMINGDFIEHCEGFREQKVIK